jgi:ABC-type transporter Mla subunit MlaD
VDTVYIYQAQLGPPWIEIEALPTNSAVPHPKKPGEVVPTKFKAEIPPDPFSQISRLAEQLRPALQELGPALARIAVLAENLNSVISDQQNRDNLRQSLANLSQAGQDASEALAEFKAFAAQARQSTSELTLEFRDAGRAVIDSSRQISQLLSHLDQTVQQINQGQGTAGKVLYDPALYEEMLSSTENLNEAISEFRTLLNKWSREGLKVKW